MTWGRIAVAAALALAVSACANNIMTLAEPAPDAPSATIVHVIDPYSMLGNETLWVAEDETCLRLGHLSWHDDIFHRADNLRRVPAGRRLFLRAVKVDSTSAMGRGQWNCVHVVSFVPVDGRRYTVMQHYSLNDRTCRLDITDETTHGSPATLIDHPVAGRCGRAP